MIYLRIRRKPSLAMRLSRLAIGIFAVLTAGFAVASGDPKLMALYAIGFVVGLIFKG